jgi:hypothetical protein
MKSFNKMSDSERAEIKNFRKIKKAATVLAHVKKLVKTDDKKPNLSNKLSQQMAKKNKK